MGNASGTGDCEVHCYRPRMSRLRLALIVVGEVGWAVGILNGRWIYAVPAVVGMVALITSRGGRYGPELRLSPEGLAVYGVEMPWSNVERIESVRRFGFPQDRLMLHRAIVRSHGGATSRWIDLRTWDRQWRTGRIADDIARWAPRLADQPALVRP